MTKKNENLTDSKPMELSPMLNEVGGAVELNLPTCEDCICHITLYKHPWNKGELKGSITQSTGLYACIVEHIIDKDRKGIISDRIGNGCELHKKV